MPGKFRFSILDLVKLDVWPDFKPVQPVMQAWRRFNEKPAISEKFCVVYDTLPFLLDYAGGRKVSDVKDSLHWMLEGSE